MGIGDWIRSKLGRKSKVVSVSGQPVYTYENKDPKRKIGMADVPDHWAGLRESHYEKWLGPCETVHHEIIPMIPHVDVYIHPPCPEKGRDFYTLITGGMSDLPMHLPPDVPKELARAELLMYVPSVEIKPGSVEQPWEVGWLRFLARFVHEYETWFAEGHTIPNGNPPEPLLPGSELTTALLMAPVFEESGFVEGLDLDGEPVNFLWLNPITDAECQLKLAKGTDALYDLMERSELPQVLDVYRRSMV